MIWVLVIVISGYVHTVDFSTQAKCVDASTAVMAQAGQPVHAFCIQRD